MKHTQRRNLLRDIAWLLATPLAARQTPMFDKRPNRVKPAGNSERSNQAQVVHLRPRIAPPNQSVMRRV